jgi:hypothetical protein
MTVTWDLTVDSEMPRSVKPSAVLSMGGPEEQLQSLCLNISCFADVSNNLIVCFSLLSEG